MAEQGAIDFILKPNEHGIYVMGGSCTRSIGTYIQLYVQLYPQFCTSVFRVAYN